MLIRKSSSVSLFSYNNLISIEPSMIKWLEIGNMSSVLLTCPGLSCAFFFYLLGSPGMVWRWNVP